MAGQLRKDRTVFWIYTSNGWVSKTVNQRTNGGKRVYLSTYPTNVGYAWNVQVSNRSSGTDYIVTDAIKIVHA